MNGLSGLSAKLMPVFKNLITEAAKLSWIAALAMCAIGGALYMFGNEYGAKKLCKNAIYGWVIIQIVNMLA